MPEENKDPDKKDDDKGAKPDASSGTGAGGNDKKDDDDLGPGGYKALQAERAAREKAERERDAAAAERDDLKSKHQSAEEKAIEDAKKAGRDEATLEANRRITRSEVKGAASGKLADPEDAAAMLGDLDRFIVKGEVDSKAISSAIDDLVKAKPYLAAAGTRARGLPGGGAKPSTGTSFNDDLRRKIRGG